MGYITPAISDLLYCPVYLRHQPWAPNWDIPIFADHTRRNIRKTKSHDLHTHACPCLALSCASWGFSYVLIFMLWPQQTEQMQVTCAPDESQLFWFGEKPEYPQFGCRWCLISPVYIYGRPQVLAYAKKNNNNNNNNCLVVLQVFKKERVSRSFFFFFFFFIFILVLKLKRYQ